MHLKYFYFLLVIIGLTSCNTGRNLAYLSNLDSEALTPVQNDIAPRIKNKDLLSITVSSLDPESNVLFNTGKVLPATAMATEETAEGYLVNAEGYINFPVIGKILLAGLTKEEATEKMTELVSKHVKNPIVNIRFLNFTVTVLGEVNKPSTFAVPDENVNILEALALAGDMTVFGKRENVLLIRVVNGARTTTRIDLNDKNLLDSPYFYLQQNDILYVEPHNRSKIAQVSSFNRYIPIIVSAISAVAIYLTTVSR